MSEWAFEWDSRVSERVTKGCCALLYLNGDVYVCHVNDFECEWMRTLPFLLFNKSYYSLIFHTVRFPNVPYCPTPSNHTLPCCVSIASFDWRREARSSRLPKLFKPEIVRRFQHRPLGGMYTWLTVTGTPQATGGCTNYNGIPNRQWNPGKCQWRYFPGEIDYTVELTTRGVRNEIEMRRGTERRSGQRQLIIAKWLSNLRLITRN